MTTNATTTAPDAGITTRTALDLTGHPDVPARVGPFSHAVRWGDLLFVTGQMPTLPDTGEVVAGGVAEQTEQVLRNLTAVLAPCGAGLDDALMVRVYLEDFDDFDAVNTVYRRWFAEPRPARTCVGVRGLAVGARVEIDLIVGLVDGGER
ncbi:RidA family protein [Mycetocola reblochoni]|uniref:Endoribonuclease L-PSP n=2 Tax=Mycetocola reblochoni TaxID=331618 RepID=A0A1R4JXJ3_9MICO|nr:Rid family detoxifying hydrolase [Mycetocola reblochoni]RLP70608.1 RidA family protein [Mycetocola reblochoni]SJN36614.1 Endoribonuclease L-PSP [Mycetocola reblochoni REB411]